MERWGMNLDELYQAIFFLFLPAHNSNYERLPAGVDPHITKGPGKDPLSHLDQLTLHPTWPYIWGESVDEILCSLYFRMKDVKKFEEKYGKKYDFTIRGKDTIETLDQDIPSVSHQDETTETDVEDFIKNLRVSYESDSEVKIQEPNRIGKTFNHGSLGFSSNQTKQWKAFINVLQDPPHIYELGPAHKSSDALRKKIRKPEYERRQKRLIKNNISPPFSTRLFCGDFLRWIFWFRSFW